MTINQQTNADKLKQAIAIADDDPDAESLNGRICVIRAGGKMLLPDRHKIIVLSKTQASSIVSELEAKSKQVEALRKAIKVVRLNCESFRPSVDTVVVRNYSQVYEAIQSAIALCEPPASGRETE